MLPLLPSAAKQGFSAKHIRLPYTHRLRQLLVRAFVGAFCMVHVHLCQCSGMTGRMLLILKAAWLGHDV